MKAHRITAIVFDFDDVGDELRDIIENTKYPNRCIAPTVTKIETVELGEWNDGLRINNFDTMSDEFERLLREQSSSKPNDPPEESA